MTEPITVITLSYGRLHHLAEAVQSFLNQDYTGEKEMIVFNTLLAQKLKGSLPNVRIVNYQTRPESLGATRNAAIEMAKDGWIFILDDDDVWLPSHLSRYVQHFEGHDWLWLNRQFYSLGRHIKQIVQGSCPVFAFRKSVWKAVGGYALRDCGEDRDFITKVTQSFKGKRIETPPNETTFIYSWADGNFHLSGEGDDRPGRPSGHDRAGAWINERVKNGSIPSGEIEIVPRWSEDYIQQARDYIAHLDAGSKKNDCCIVLLGRYGDIINALPIARHVHEKFATPNWMVSAQFADIFDGVSYVKPYVVDLPNDHLEDAFKIARREFTHVLQAQVWGGPTYPQERKTEAFNMESWRNCGFLHEFRNKDWYPVFDKRDAKREQAIVARLAGQKPKLLVNTTTSSSSPFQYGRELLDAIIQRCSGRYQIVNLGELKCHRIYDILGLFETSAALLTIDTAYAHLAGATGIPVIALVNDKPWLGSVPRANVVARIPYGYGAVDAAVKAVEGLNNEND